MPEPLEMIGIGAATRPSPLPAVAGSSTSAVAGLSRSGELGMLPGQAARSNSDCSARIGSLSKPSRKVVAAGSPGRRTSRS